MINLLILSIITTLFINGWKYATTYLVNWEIIPNKEPNLPSKRIQIKPNDYEILGLLHWYIRCVIAYILPKQVDFIIKPLFGCQVCMASVYGTLFYWGYYFSHQTEFNYLILIKWVVLCVSVAGCNAILKNRNGMQ